MKFTDIFIIVVFSVGALSCVHKNEKRLERGVAQTPTYGELLPDPQKYPELNFSKLVFLIEKNNIGSLQEVLSSLSGPYKSYLEFHTFAYDSFSLQSSDYQHPRAIVFGPNARFIMTFNSPSPNKTHSGTDALELMSFDPETKSFELREIRFRKDATEDLEEFRGRNYSISDPNPRKCLACHSSSNTNQWIISKSGQKYDNQIRPIWDSYPFWRGFYGSVDDRTVSLAPEKRTTLFETENTRESEEFQRFMDPQTGNRYKGRYRYLPEMTKTLDREVNSLFTILLSQYNFQRIAHRFAVEAEKNPEIKRARYNLVLPIFCRIQTEDGTYVPRRDLKLVNPSFNHFERDIRQYVQTEFQEAENKIKRIAEYERIPLRERNSSDVLDIVYRKHPIAAIQVLSQFLGVSTEDWAMRVTIGGVDLNDGIPSFHLFAKAFLDEIFTPKERLEMAPLFDPYSEFSDKTLCDVVKARAVTL